MCIDFDGHHSGGSSFVYVNYFCYYRNCLYITGTSSALKKKKKQVKSPIYMVLHPEIDSDPPIGSDQESGRDRNFGMKFLYGNYHKPYLFMDC